MADDRPGLVETLSSTIKDNKGNWLESRMAHMAGKFAGIVRVQVPSAQKNVLTNALNALNQAGWTINVESIDSQTTLENGHTYQINLVGNDRPGIVQDVSAVLAAQGVNVLELSTHYESAAMTAEALFKTQAKVLIPNGVDADELKDTLENISNDLMVEVQSVA